MKTPRELYHPKPTVYTCELETCLICGGPLVEWGYQSGAKTVQSMTKMLTIAQRPKRCADPQCPWHTRVLKSARWQQIAPWYCTYGYDVIAQIGWERQMYPRQFADIHAALSARFHIGESEVRYLYHQKYLPLLACLERQQIDRLKEVAKQSGLLLTLDGLAPEGGEPQLWLVRELQTGLTVRCGWLSMQDHTTFVNFLQPIADLGLRVAATLSDKQRGLMPALDIVFPTAKHGLCQTHYLKNAATPVAEADEKMKVALRQDVRDKVGSLIRQEKVAEAPGVLTVTGLLPSPLPGAAEAQSEATVPAQCQAVTPDGDARERETIVQDLLRRVRYLLTLKGRPPLRLAGIEMFERLNEVLTCLDQLLQHQDEPRLRELQQGLKQALATARQDYQTLNQAAGWLQHIADLLDPQDKPARTGDQVRQELWVYLDQIHKESNVLPQLGKFCATIRQYSRSYDSGLFHTYDVPGLPRTNNARESEFRDLGRRLLSTTGQKGLALRIIQREGAWELIPRLGTLNETITGLSQVGTRDLVDEQQRVRDHRSRFRLHVRSAKQSRSQLAKLVKRWVALPATSGP
jgi:hypothetical protein